MTFYTGYFDESGHETNPLFVFGGLVMDVEDPRNFEREWMAAIDPLPMLHTSQFLTGLDDFKQWNSKGLEWKQDLLRRAAKVIEKHALSTFSTALSMESFREISCESVGDEPSFDRAVAHPYALCARFSAVQMGLWSRPNGIPGRVNMVLENRNGRDVREVREVFLRDHLDTPSFEDKSVPPLQAADLIAVMFARKIMQKPNFVQVQSAYSELNQVLHTNDFLHEDRLRGIWKEIRAQIITRPTPPGEKSGTYFQNDLTAARRPFERPKKIPEPRDNKK
jgi:hypothetical protein